jgi:hypothetical protein
MRIAMRIAFLVLLYYWPVLVLLQPVGVLVVLVAGDWCPPPRDVGVCGNVEIS